MIRPEMLQKVTPAHWLKTVQQGGGRFAILTPDNPYDASKQMSHDQMRARLNDLQRKGHIEGFFPAKGLYEDPLKPENSYVVVNPKNFDHVVQLGRDAGQDSVLLSHQGKHQVVRTNLGAADQPQGPGQVKAADGTVKPDVGHGYTGKGPVNSQQSFQPFSTKVSPRSAKKPSYLSLNTNYGDPQSIEPAQKSEGAMVSVERLRRLRCAFKNCSKKEPSFG